MSKYNTGITASELIDQLSELSDDDQALPVEVEGCDCIGPCEGVEIIEGIDGQRLVLITRKEEKA